MISPYFSWRNIFFAVTSVLLAGLSSHVSGQIPAFPGAEGFGAYATGGRGGDVYYVTTLNNNGAGSLREALNTAPAAGRTIVFAVSGYIPVVSDTNFNVPAKVTIAGQTAPGDGVGLRGGRMLISGSNVIMRHFRIRHGKYGTGGDCLNINSSAHSTMLDHISLMFSTDENFSFFNSSVNNFTMQYSNSTWGMERHNAGGLWDLQNGSCHHTLWAHHRTRNPKARPVGLLEWINNVTFHWRNEGFIMGDSQTPMNWKANVRGCYYISIDDADSGSTVRSTALTKALVASNGVPNFSLFLDNTLYDYDDDGILDGTNRGYSIVSGSEFTPGDPIGANRYYKSPTPFTGATGLAAVTIDNPLTAYKKVVSSAAPLRLDANYTGPLRDELDTLLVDSVVNQYSILVQKDGKVAGEDPERSSNGEQHLADKYGITNNGFGTLNGTTAPADADLDGMPDFWELALHGKNGILYNLAGADHNTAFTAGQLPSTFFPAGTPVGYTLLEEYLHFKAVPHATVARNIAGSPSVQTVDLRKYTDAFSKSPTFNLTNVSNGTVQQFLANGTALSATGPIVKFTPTANYVGRAGFNFTVSDADGSQWTQQFAILVSGSTVPRDVVWIGGNAGNVWDDTTMNWRSAGAATAFSDGDTTLFDDRGSNSPTIAIQGSRLTSGMSVTGSKDYAFTGPGNLSSTGSLTKAGDTNLTLSTLFNFVGGTLLNGGQVILNNGGSIDGGRIQFTGNSTLTSNHGSATGDTLGINPNIEVTAGSVGNLNLSQRVNVSGSLSGSGVLNVFSPSNLGTEGRVYFDGTSAGYTGTVNISGGANAPGNGGRVAFRNVGGAFNGFPSARVHLSGVDFLTSNGSGGNTYTIGQLSGDANARLRSAYSGGATTWEVGGLNTSASFAGVIMDGSSTTHLTKTGSGTLTLSGANTYTGATAISGGVLHVSGSLGATAVSVASGARVSGNFPVAGSLALAGGSTTDPGAAPGQPGTITVGNGLTLSSGSTLLFDLSSTPGGANDRISVTAGTLSQTGTINFLFNLTEGFLNAGQYNLVTDAPTSSASSVALTHNFPTTTRQSYVLSRSSTTATGAKQIWLTVSGTPASLTWTGANGANWNLNSTTNFTGSSTGDNKFYNLDQVIFNDAASSGNVTLTGTLQPRSVLVSNSSLAYTFSGTGTIGGNTQLIKSGGGVLTISNSNAYTGGTIVNAGTLAVSGATPLGSGPITMNGGTLALPNASTFLSNSMIFSGSSAITSPYSGNSTVLNSTSNTMTSVGNATVNLSGVEGILSINGSMSEFNGTIAFGAGSGMLRLNSNSAAASDVNKGSAGTLFDLGTGSATLTNRNGDITIHLGALQGGPGTQLRGRQTGSGATSTTYVIGALNTNNTFAGTIAHAGDQSGVDIVKVGTGTWTVSGNSNFTGSVAVDAGTFAVSGSLTCTGGADVSSGAALHLNNGTLAVADLQIAPGGSLTGLGTIVGEVVNNGTVTSTGLTITGSVVNNGTMIIKSGGQLAVSGSFVNFGVLDLLSSGGGLPADFENNGVVIDATGLELVSAGIEGNNFTLTMMTYEGHTYRLQVRESLTSGTWQNVGEPVAGDGDLVKFVHTGGAGEAKGFYRVAVD